MDYRPNFLASTLASRRSHHFAVLVPSPQTEDSYWNKPLKGIQRALEELQPYGILLTLYPYDQRNPKTFESKSKEILDSSPDGVVLAPFFSREALLFIGQLDQQKIPYVFIDSNLKNTGAVSYIGQASFQSGMLAAKLLHYMLKANEPVLVVHFAKAMDDQNHLIQREQGFHAYFAQLPPSDQHPIKTIKFEQPHQENDFKLLDRVLLQQPQTGGIFVTNSQVYRMADYLARRENGTIRLIGHDLIRQNVSCLKNGMVDFLICQRPEQQGYQSINALFQHIMLKNPVPAENYTPIDIITKENIDYYNEFNLINYGTTQF